MGRWFDARETPEGWRFREWSSIVDCYLTPPMTDAKTRAVMLQSYTDLEVRCGAAAKDIDERIARAHKQGTTCRHDTQDTKGPWEPERCDRCSTFHHAFVLRVSDGACSHCGEPAHAPTCAESEDV